MRFIAFAFAFLFATSSFAKETVSGLYLAKTLAQMCDESTFKAFANAVKEERFLASEYPRAKLNIDNKIVFVKEMGLKVWKEEDNTFKAVHEKQTYSGKDACDLLTNMVKAEEKTSLFNFVVPDAEARSLFRQKKLGMAVQAAVGAGILGIGVATGGVGFMAGGIVGGSLLYDSSQEFKKAYALESLLNSDFKLSCTQTQITIEGEGYKLVGNKYSDKKGQKLRTQLIGAKNGSSIIKSDNFQTFGNLGAFVHKMAYACSDTVEADKIKSNIKTEQQKVAVQIDFLSNSVHYMKGSTPTDKVLKTK